MKKPNDLFEQIISCGPSPSTLFLVLTRMKEEGRFSEVIQECVKALGTYPDEIRLRRLLAECYLEVGFISQAETELERVTSDISDLMSAYKLQAESYVRQGRGKEASEALKRYLAHKPDDQEAISLLERIKPLEEEHLTEVSEIADEVSRTEEDLFPELATPTLAEIYCNQGQIQEAIVIYEKVLFDNPLDNNSMKRLAELKALSVEQTRTSIADENNLRAKKEKTIAILEGWLVRIQELSHA